MTRLPAIEFAINLARSESTGYSPFFLNTGRLPRVMVWDAPSKDEYPNIRVYAQRMKLALWNAHDILLSARVKQTIQANRRRRACPFVTGDLVYVSTKNINLPKGTFRKLVPKYMGPYRISEDFGTSDRNVKFAMIRDDSAEVLNTNTRSPTLTSIIRQEDADTRHTADQEKESGTWISKERADMIEDVLWEYMEKGQKGKKLRDQAIRR